MLPLTFVTAVGLLTSIAEGAPTQETVEQQSQSWVSDAQQAEAREPHFHSGFFEKRLQRHKDVVRHGLFLRGFQIANGTSTVKSAQPPSTGAPELVVDDAAPVEQSDDVTSSCGVVSTKTIDVTVYLTPTPRSDDEDEDTTLVPKTTVTGAPTKSVKDRTSTAQSNESTSKKSTTSTRTSGPRSRSSASASSKTRKSNGAKSTGVSSSSGHGSNTRLQEVEGASSRRTASPTTGPEPTPKTTVVSSEPTTSSDDSPRKSTTTILLRSKSSGSSSTTRSPSRTRSGPQSRSTAPSSKEDLLRATTTSKSRKPTSTKPSQGHTSTADASTEEPCEEEDIEIDATHFTTTIHRSKEPSGRPSATAKTTSARVIDVSMTPVATSVLTATPARPAQPTSTVSDEDAEVGAPVQDRTYCGVQGEPAGTYFIAEFIENRSGVPVSLEGCYEFCDSVMDSTEGCQAYRFYYNEFGAPRCSLYGMPVPWIVRDLDNDEPDRWFDLECGSPREKKWTSGSA